MNHPTHRLRAVAILSVGVVALSLAFTFASRAADDADAGWVTLFNGKDFTGWKFRNEHGPQTWKVFADAKLDPADAGNLIGEGEGKEGSGIMLRQKIDHGSDLFTEKDLADGEYHIEVMVPKNSNSGVYLEGEYEVQVLDSFGKKEVGPGDMGGIYNTKAPSENAAKAPGEWQTLHIIFQAPKFDAAGKKTQNAKFVLVELNGKKIHENVEAPKPTGSELPGGEKAAGPLLFQGDHGIVAFRSVKWRPMK